MQYERRKIAIVRWVTTVAAFLGLTLGGIVGAYPAIASHGAALHNATEQHSGNWYGSSAYISWTNPSLNGGNWVYHRTSTNHQSDIYCFRFTEIGWFKDANGMKGIIVWDNGCNRQERSFSVSGTTHRYSQQYFTGSDGKDYYQWYVDGGGIGSGVTNFSYSSTVTEGGEVAVGQESMGNTLAYDNQRVVKNADGTYTRVLWGSHTNYVDDAPYTNANGPDPNNDFYSKGNE